MRRLPAIAVVLLAAPASAGTLHDVVNGLGKASGSLPAPSSSGSGGGGASAGDVIGAILDGFLHPDASAAASGATSFAQPIFLPEATPDANLSAFLGIQSVVGSDGAGTAEVRASFEDFGIGVAVSRYWEGATMTQGSVHLDDLRLFGSYRLMHDGPTSVWLDAGGAAVLALEDQTLIGATAGLRVERHVAGDIGVTFHARGSYYRHNIIGVESEVAVDLWLLRVGYRLLAFDVGPPLHGPEVGISLSF